MNTQLSSKVGSDNSIFGMKEFANIKKSRFDFSKKRYLTTDIGSIVPIDWFDVYPGDKIKLNLKYLIDTFPLEVPPFTSYFVRTHWYFLKKSAMWKGWNTFITRGRSGSIDLEIPSISKADLISSYQNAGEIEKFYNLSCPNSLSNYLGLKPYYYNNDNTKSSYLPYLFNTSDSFTQTGYDYVTKVSALPFMAYQKIVRYNYLPSNLLQDNKVWFPDDLEDHWYIDYSSSNLSGRLFVPESASIPNSPTRHFVPSVSDNCVDLLQLRYAQFGDDYFTTAKPWLVRGSEQTLDFTASADGLKTVLSDLGIDVSDSYLSINSVSDVDVTSSSWFGASHVTGAISGEPIPALLVNNGDSNSPVMDADKLNYVKYRDIPKILLDSYSRSLGVDVSSLTGKTLNLASNFSANTLRNLLALSVWQERNTLTNGSYNQTIQVHWNEKPRAPEYAPMYLGGTTDLVSFGQVIQSSSSVSGSPLGTKAGTGSASNSSDVFTFDASDYGIIMGVMIISPEVVYSQGIGHEWTDLTFDEQFQPEFANLGYQPILNKELFVSGNESDDDDLFGYQTRYAYLKHRRNETCGLFDLSPSQDSVFGPYVQARRFSSLPSLSNQFTTMSPDNIDRSFLSFSNLPAFKVQFASQVSLVRALPYQSTPETFGF